MCSSTLYLQKAHHCAIQGVSLSWILCWPASTCRLHCIRLTNVYDARMHLHKQAGSPHIWTCTCLNRVSPKPTNRSLNSLQLFAQFHKSCFHWVFAAGTTLIPCQHIVKFPYCHIASSLSSAASSSSSNFNPKSLVETGLGCSYHDLIRLSSGVWS